jgi:hypothetical protein
LGKRSDGEGEASIREAVAVAVAVDLSREEAAIFAARILYAKIQSLSLCQKICVEK